MEATTVLRRLLHTGWEAWQQDGRLEVRHATQALTSAQQRYLTQHHAALLAALDRVLAYETRAAILEYDGGCSREDAEALARPVLEDVPPEERHVC